MKERNSSFELLRLIAQFMIVVYHILLFWFINNGASTTMELHKAICIPLHIGVLLYVLISGFYGIRFSISGVIKIIANLLIYGLIFSLIGHFLLGDKLGLSHLLFVSNTPFWFVKIYLMLYLIAPLLNILIKQLSPTNRLILILILAWMSCYIGLLGLDKSLTMGKNLIHFTLLYIIGNTLALYKEQINSIHSWKIVLSYLVVNIFSISIYLLLLGHTIETICYDFVFQYNSPLLILNATCFFIPFMRISIHSKVINYLAGSCLAIYLIHSSTLVLFHPIKKFALVIQEMTSNIFVSMSFVIVLALTVCCFAIALDKLLTPYWNLVAKFSAYINSTKIGAIALTWANQKS